MNAAVNTFKSYSEKSKATRALVQVHKLDKDVIGLYLTQVEGKWGFHLTDEGTPMSLGLHGANDTKETPVQLLTEPQGEVVSDETPAEEKDDTEVKANTAFGNFAMQQLTAPVARAASPQRTESGSGRGIEKNRPEQNGVKRPSIGGLCRAVWDALDVFRANAPGNVVSAKDVKALAEANGWNQNNASIEFYQWRKFNSITKAGK